jgi:hypothetical protein
MIREKPSGRREKEELDGYMPPVYSQRRGSGKSIKKDDSKFPMKRFIGVNVCLIALECLAFTKAPGAEEPRWRQWMLNQQSRKAIEQVELMDVQDNILSPEDAPSNPREREGNNPLHTGGRQPHIHAPTGGGGNSQRHPVASFTIRENLSPNRSERTRTVSKLVLHTTEGSGTGAESWLINPQSKASAHYIVMEDGREVVRLVPEAERAWHARGHNNDSIGIEIAGYHNRDIPESQLRVAVELAYQIMQRHGLGIDDVYPHSQLDPGRKMDPGEANFRRLVFGIRDRMQSGQEIQIANL